MAIIPHLPKTSNLPPNLYPQLANTETPWHVSESVFNRATIVPGKSYKKCEVLPQDPEWDFVYRYFNHPKPTNRAIGRIYYIHNAVLSKNFEGDIRKMELQTENSAFSPSWDKGSEKPIRQRVIQRWNDLTSSYSPFKIPVEGNRKDVFLNTRILPLWHGTSAPICESICQSGFTFFGKQVFSAGGGNTQSTDPGFFGSGIYFTNSARYAADIYSQGHLIMGWVSMREPFPVIADKSHPAKPTDMQHLMGKGAYANYNAHYIPVVSIDPQNPACTVYYPCTKNQVPVWDELVVFQESHTLPRFWIEMVVDLPTSIKSMPFYIKDLQELVQNILKNADFQNYRDLYELIEKKSKKLVDYYSTSEILPPREHIFYVYTTQLLDGGKKIKANIAQDLLQFSSPISIVSNAVNTITQGFGRKKWKINFGSIGKEPPLPSNIDEILQKPCPIWRGKKIEDTHMLTLIPKTVEGKLLTIKLLAEIVSQARQGNQTQFKYIWKDVLTDFGDMNVLEPHWVLMTRNVIPHTRGKSYQEQLDILKGYNPIEGMCYQPPELIEAAASILLRYVDSKECLYSDDPEWTWTFCQEGRLDNQVVVGGFDMRKGKEGLKVDYTNKSNQKDDKNSYGMAGLIKL